MKETLENLIEAMQKRIHEIILEMDPELAQLFLQEFNRILNEQTTYLQENSGASR